MDQHRALVDYLSQEVSQFRKNGIPLRIYHGNTNSTRTSTRNLNNSLDTSPLNNILSIDTSKKTCLVEPNVPMDALVAATLPYGLIPPVVPEFPGITVGGAFAGTAGESSSFKYGFFDRTVNWIEIILADGEVVTASDAERADLFIGAAGTFGTLGVVTLFELKLIPARTFVELTYHPVDGIRNAEEIMERVSKRKETAFVDGIMFARDRGVIMYGKLVDETSGAKAGEHLPIVTFSKPWDQWFYLHAEQQLEASRRTMASSEYLDKVLQNSSYLDSNLVRDLIPVTDYLFRYDRGAFWTGRLAFSFFVTPFNRGTRWLLDNFMHTRTMYHALHRSGLVSKFIVQDMAVPSSRAEEFSDWLDEETDIYPRWLCHLKQGESVSMNPHQHNNNRQQNSDYLLNFGVWGRVPSGQTAMITNRRIEAKLKSLQGMKWLYAETFYTEDEFWSIYDRKWYEELRQKYKAESLPNVYHKVGPREVDENWYSWIWNVWPISGVYGVLSSLKGGDYLRRG